MEEEKEKEKKEKEKEKNDLLTCGPCGLAAGKKMENFQNKRGLKGCKWSSLNAPGTENHLSHPILQLGEFPFLIIGPLG